MHVADIMSTEVRAITPEASLQRARDQMKQAQIRHLVVMERGQVVGILSDRDVFRTRAAGERFEWTVADAMTPRVITVAPTTTVRRAANLLRGHVIGCLPVLDGARLVGIITTSDLLALIAAPAARRAAPASPRVAKVRSVGATRPAPAARAASPARRTPARSGWRR